MADRAHWEARYAAPGFAYGTAPSPWVEACEPLLPQGAAVLVPGDGEGRNGVFLARLGHDVTALDRSAAGLEKARRLAAASGVSIRTIEADLAEWTVPPAAFDAVVLVYLHLPPSLRGCVHGALASGLRPGGLLVLEGFDVSHWGLPGGGPRDPAWLFDSAILRGAFAALDEEVLEIVDDGLDEGPFHQGAARLLRGRWRKPTVPIAG